MDTRNKIFAVVGTVAILATAGIAGVALFSGGNSTSNSSGSSLQQASSSSNSSSSTGTNVSTTASTTGYKDGTYTATVNYSVPHGGSNTLKATVTISSGKISAVTTNDDYTDGESSMYVSSFEGSVSSDASRQSIGTYGPSRIGGASLTTAAFYDAISQIRSQAISS